jgi:DNA helicase HerA-like ATPase
MSKLHISEKLSLPIDAVTQKFGILGRTGSGKSYAATKLAEEMLDAKAQIVVLDPVGVWWGLRVAKDGKSEAYKIPVLGGMHGDIPLEPGAGALIADLIVDKAISAVVDLSGFLISEQRRFATDFAMQFFHRKKSQRSAVHLFIEEAQEFVPQHVRGDVAKMVGSFERLLKLGRNFGIGATLISQRPQSVNKDVLNQTECLLAFQMTGPQERKTVQGWIAEKGIDEDIAGDLPHLKIGEAHIWSPQWLQISKTIRIAEKKTADVSSTPKPGVKPIEPKELSQIDLENLSDKMLATIEKAKSEDPKELRKQIVDLKRELAKKPVEKSNTQFKTVEKPVLKDSQFSRAEKLLKRLDDVMPKVEIALRAILNDAQKVLMPFREAVAKLNSPALVGATKPLLISRPAVARRPAPLVTIPREQLRPAANGSNETGQLGIGERRCAIAIAQHPNGVMREQLTTLTGYKRSTRNTYLQRMLSAGYVTQLGERFTITDAGIDWIGSDYQPLPTGKALQNYWIEKLPAGESSVFQVVLQNPEGITREEIGEQTEFKRSTRNTYLQRIAARELVTISGDVVRPSETLFEEAAE